MLMIESDMPGAAAADELERAEAACRVAGATDVVRAADAQEADWLRQARRAAHYAARAARRRPHGGRRRAAVAGPGHAPRDRADRARSTTSGSARSGMPATATSTPTSCSSAATRTRRRMTEARQEGPLPGRPRPRRHGHRRARHRDGAARLARGPEGRRCGPGHARDQGGPRSARHPQSRAGDLGRVVRGSSGIRRGGPYPGHERLDAPVDHAPRVRPGHGRLCAADRRHRRRRARRRPLTERRPRRPADPRRRAAPRRRRPRRPSPRSPGSRRSSPPTRPTPTPQRDLGLRAPPAGPRDRRSVPLRAGRAPPSRRPGGSLPTTPWSWPGSAASSSASTSSPRRSTTGRAAVALSPNLAAARAVVVDALVELGRYDEADAAAGGDARGPGRPLDAGPRLVPRGAARQARRRARARCSRPPRRPVSRPENVAFVDALLGNLLVYTGDPDGCRGRLRACPRARARARPVARRGGPAGGRCRRPRRGDRAVPARRGHPAAARVRHRPGRCPAGGRPTRRRGPQLQARPRRDPAVPGQRASSSTSTSRCSRPTTATRPRRSRFAKAGYAATPTVRAADALAWALHRLGRDDGGEDALATRRSGWARATRCCATTPARSRRRSATSTARAATSSWRSPTDPGFSATGAAEARRILDSLPD